MNLRNNALFLLIVMRWLRFWRFFGGDSWALSITAEYYLCYVYYFPVIQNANQTFMLGNLLIAHKNATYSIGQH